MNSLMLHTERELIAHGKTLEQVKQAIGLREDESLIYATPEDIRKANGYTSMCNECYRDGEL
jgi:glutamine phosphoribosylpyrophosphate amidotransferase